MDNIRHIFFDLDNTLWDFDTNSRETLAELFTRFRLAEKTSVGVDFFIQRYLAHNDHYWELYRQNRISKTRLRKARFERTMADIGIRDPKLVRDASAVYIEQCPQKTALNEGALECVKYFAGTHTLHILSNGFHEVQLCKLQASGLSPYFAQVITSEKASAKKPSPRIFEYAMKVSGAGPSQVLMVGDKLDADVVGALEAGWRAVHFNPHGVAHSYTSIARLADLKALLK